MILQRLAEHYDRLEAQVSSGFSNQLVSFRIVIDRHGAFQAFQDARIQEGKFFRPRRMQLPGQTKSSGSGLNPCFLWDRSAYLLGLTYDPDPKKQQRAKKSFEAFRNRHLKFQSRIADERFNAVCNFLSTFDSDLLLQNDALLREITRDCGVFMFAGEQGYLHEMIQKPPDWETKQVAVKGKARALSGDLQQCLVTGQLAATARLHKPEIKGVVGAPPRGVPFVSMNEPAYQSYGKDQSFNAPVSVDAVFKYATALNHLLADGKRRIVLGESSKKTGAQPPVTVAYWADKQDTVTEIFIDALFADFPLENLPDAPPEDESRLQEARLLLTQMRDGTANTRICSNHSNARFFILGLVPNAARLSVRIWVEQDASELRRRLGEHISDLALHDEREHRQLSIRRIVIATGRSERKESNGKHVKFDIAAVSPQLAGDLARSVLLGTPYPQSVLATMIRRIRSDGEVAYARVSAIKAVLVRNSRLYKQSPEDQMKLDLDHEQTDAAYRCGRIFAALEKAQEESVKEASNVELNSTIKDRFFGAAAATPLLVLPRLLILHNHHLRKLKAGRKRSFEILMQQIISSAPFEFPRQSTLEQQGRFIVGYFQQRQDFFKSRKNDQQISEEQSTDE